MRSSKFSLQKEEGLLRTRHVIVFFLWRMNYEWKPISKLEIVIENKRMEVDIQTTFIFQRNLHTNLKTCPPFHKSQETCGIKFLWLLSEPRADCSFIGRPTRCSSSILVRPSENFCAQLWTAWRDRQCSAYMGGISLWISFAAIPFSHKNRTTPRCSIVVHVFTGAAIL